MPGPGRNGRTHRASDKNDPSLVTCSSHRVTRPGSRSREIHRTGHGNVRSCFVLIARQLIEQAAESRHAAFEIFQPRRGAPDFDAHRRPDDLHFAARLDAQKLAKALGNHQPAAAGKLHRPVPGGKQPAEKLHLGDPLLKLACPHLLLDQLDPLVEPRLPDRGAPQAQAAGPFLGQNAVGRFGQPAHPPIRWESRAGSARRASAETRRAGILANRTWLLLPGS